MQELRLVTAIDEGARLLLRAPDGSEYALPLDEKLKAAARGDRVRLGQLEIETDTPLRPRDIQARIRAGESAADVAAAAGIPLERVRRYEGPVLAEREHMAAMARRTALRGSAVSEGPVPLLGDVVWQRLRERGIDPDGAAWDSWRREDAQWQVVLTYRPLTPEPAAARGGRSVGAPAERAGAEGLTPGEVAADPTERALFLFDPARRTVGPDDVTAGLLLAEPRARGTADAAAALIPHTAGSADSRGEQQTDDDAPSRTADPTGGRGRARGGRAAKSTARGSSDRPASSRRDTEEPPGETVDVPAAMDSGPLRSDTGMPRTDGTSALGPSEGPRRDRGAAAFLGEDDGLVIPRVGVPAMGGLVPLAPVPPRRPLQREGPQGERPARRSRRPHVPASATAPIRRQSIYEERLITPAAERPPSTPRPRRPSVPSWDEILFGTRTRGTD